MTYRRTPGSGPRYSRGMYTPPSDYWMNPDNVTSTTSTALTSGVACFLPVDIGPVSLTVKGLGCNVTTATVPGPATVTVTMGLYPDDGTGSHPDFPNILSQMVVDTTTTGIKYGAFGVPITLTPGRYWAALLYQATGTPTTAPSFTCSVGYGMPYAASSPPGTLGRSLTLSGQTALPTSGSPALGAGGTANAPIVAIRAN